MVSGQVGPNRLFIACGSWVVLTSAKSVFGFLSRSWAGPSGAWVALGLLGGSCGALGGPWALMAGLGPLRGRPGPLLGHSWAVLTEKFVFVDSSSETLVLFLVFLLVWGENLGWH